MANTNAANNRLEEEKKNLSLNLHYHNLALRNTLANLAKTAPGTRENGAQLRNLNRLMEEVEQALLNASHQAQATIWYRQIIETWGHRLNEYREEGQRLSRGPRIRSRMAQRPAGAAVQQRQQTTAPVRRPQQTLSPGTRITTSHPNSSRQPAAQPTLHEHNNNNLNPANQGYIYFLPLWLCAQFVLFPPLSSPFGLHHHYFYPLVDPLTKYQIFTLLSLYPQVTDPTNAEALKKLLTTVAFFTRWIFTHLNTSLEAEVFQALFAKLPTSLQEEFRSPSSTAAAYSFASTSGSSQGGSPPLLPHPGYQPTLVNLLAFLRHALIRLTMRRRAEARALEEEARFGSFSGVLLRYCAFCKRETSHNMVLCPFRDDDLCHRCFLFHRHNHRHCPYPPFLPTDWLNSGQIKFWENSYRV